MIDEGQTDWKIIAIDNTDPMARKLSDISDIDVYMPGLIKTTLDWFRLYKVSSFFYNSVHLKIVSIFYRVPLFRKHSLDFREQKGNCDLFRKSSTEMFPLKDCDWLVSSFLNADWKRIRPGKLKKGNSRLA